MLIIKAHQASIAVALGASMLLASCSNVRMPGRSPAPAPAPTTQAPAPAPLPTPEPRRATVPPQSPAPVVTAPAPSQSVPTPSAPAPSVGLPSNRPAPIASETISLNGKCAQREQDGFREDATLQVERNVVKSLNWKLWVGRKGSCSFDYSQFTQTQERPHIELKAKDGSGCTLMVYPSPKWISLAHAKCESYCQGDIYDEAWPVMFDRNGSCGKIG